MTVADLIAELRTMPRDHEVWLYIGDHCTTVDRISVDKTSGTVDIFGEDA